MQIESLTGLRAAFEEWRSRKRHAREAVPAALLERARVAARRHGPAEVSRATKVCRSRLKVDDGGRRRSKAVVAGGPTFSRVELAAPVADRAFVELETATGLKVRFLEQSAETLELIATLVSSGGGR
jgi:hypothetical protein